MRHQKKNEYQVSCRFFDYIVERVNLLIFNMEITQPVVSTFIDTYPLSISICCCRLNHGKLLQLA